MTNSLLQRISHNNHSLKLVLQDMDMVQVLSKDMEQLQDMDMVMGKQNQLNMELLLGMDMELPQGNMVVQFFGKDMCSLHDNCTN